MEKSLHVPGNESVHHDLAGPPCTQSMIPQQIPELLQVQKQAVPGGLVAAEQPEDSGGPAGAPLEGLGPLASACAARVSPDQWEPGNIESARPGVLSSPEAIGRGWVDSDHGQFSEPVMPVACDAAALGVKAALPQTNASPPSPGATTSFRGHWGTMIMPLPPSPHASTWWQQSPGLSHPYNAYSHWHPQAPDSVQWKPPSLGTHPGLGPRGLPVGAGFSTGSGGASVEGASLSGQLAGGGFGGGSLTIHAEFSPYPALASLRSPCSPRVQVTSQTTTIGH